MSLSHSFTVVKIQKYYVSSYVLYISFQSKSTNFAECPFLGCHVFTTGHPSLLSNSISEGFLSPTSSVPLVAVDPKWPLHYITSHAVSLLLFPTGAQMVR